MKHLFIPYELAVIAKEKGFDEPCLAYYLPDGGLKFTITKSFNHIIDAVLYQQIVDWFREKHIIHIGIIRTSDLKFYYTVESIKRKHIMGGDCIEYYEALNKAITEAFKLI